MAENEFDKTVKLPSGSVPAQDKTVRLTREDEKTVKLATAPSAAAPVAPQPPQAQAQPLPAPVSQEIKPSSAKTALVTIATVAAILAAAWYFLPPVLSGSADKLAQSGKHAEAAQMYRRAVYLFPLKIEKYMVLLARELRLAGDVKGAQEYLEKVLAKNPNLYDAQKELGLAAKLAGQNQKALDLLQKCVGDDLKVLRWRS